MSMAALFTVAEKWKQSNCLWTHGLISKIQYMMIQRNIIGKEGKTTHAAILTRLEDMMLSEMSHFQRGEILCDCTDMRYLGGSDSQRQPGERWLPGRPGEREDEKLPLSGDGVSFKEDEKVLTVDAVIIAQQCECD